MTSKNINWNDATILEPTAAQVEIERLTAINDALAKALEFLIKHSLYANSFIHRNNELLDDEPDMIDYKIHKELAMAIYKANQILAQVKGE